MQKELLVRLEVLGAHCIILPQVQAHAALGSPGLILDLEAEKVEVSILESESLHRHWPQLDQFEGPEYRRVQTTVHAREGPVNAEIYVLAMT